MSRLLIPLCILPFLALHALADTPTEAGKKEHEAAAPAQINKAAGLSPIAEARAALAAGDVNAAEKLLAPLAESGDIDAMRELSRLYREAEGPLQDPVRARMIDEKAWALGDVWAGTRIAGDLLGSDPVRARGLLEEAAAMEGFKGWMVLGQLRLTGTGGDVDEAGAAEAFSKARDAGDNFALIHLGRMARDGRGLPQDGADAIALFEAALSTSPEVSEVAMRELISGHGLGLFGAESKPEKAIEIAKLGFQKRSAGAALGILSLPTRLETVYPDLVPLWEPALAIAGEAADKGDPMAARRLLGYWHVASLESRDAALQAAEIADRYASILDPDQLQRHKVVFAAMNGARPAEIAETFRDAQGKEAASAIFDLQKANLNAYVAVLQSKLGERGFYEGDANGTMNKRTIAAINAFCRDVKIEDICAVGPLSWQAAQALGVALMIDKN